MKIAYVLDAIYPYNRGGRETRMHEISTRLVKQGHEVHIYTMNWWKGEPHKIEEGVHLHALCKLYPLYAGERRSIKQGIMFGLACFKLIKEDWDVIDVDHMPYFPLFSCKLVCLLKRKKMIATWHEVWGKEYWQEYLGIYKGLIAYALEGLTFLMPNKVIANSELTKSKLLGHGVKKEITIVPLGIDFEYIQSIKPSTETSDVIFVGRLLAHKNVDMLIRAVAEIARTTKPDIKCIIIGEGPEEEKLKRLAEKLDLTNNIVFKGRLKNNSEVYAIMKSSKVLALLSTREGFGLVAIEANACGIGVLTLNHKDNFIKYFINKGMEGILSKLSLQDIIKNIIKMIPDQGKLRAFTDFYKVYGWESTLLKLIASYKI